MSPELWLLYRWKLEAKKTTEFEATLKPLEPEGTRATG